MALRAPLLLSWIVVSHCYYVGRTVPFALHRRSTFLQQRISTALKEHLREPASWRILSNGTAVDTLEATSVSDVVAPSAIEMQMAQSTDSSEATETWIHAVALISGTTIGAGILALPAVTVSSGFLASTVSMTVGYAIMTLSGLYIAELSLGQFLLSKEGDASIPSGGVLDLYAPAEQPNRALRQVLSIGAYFFLHYAMMVAYIAQGGSNPIFTSSFSSISDIISSSVQAGPILFTTLMATSLYALPKRVLSWMNNLMVLGVFASMAIVLVVGASTIHVDSLLLPPDVHHPEYWIQSFPIILLAFVYHNIIPTVVKDCQYDIPKIQSAIIGGTTLPFILFVAWNAVILGNIDPAIMIGATEAVDPVAILLAHEPDATVLRPMIAIFSTLAVMTSLIGFTYGLYDAWEDIFSKFFPQKRADNGDCTNDPTSSSSRFAIFALIFLPPLLMALSNPDIFVPALDYGGAFGVTLLFVLLPAYGIWMQRYGSDNVTAAEELVPGGKVPLVGLGVATGLLMVEQVVEKFGFLFQASPLG